MVARDFGRPFHDLKMALRDGYDDRGPIDPMHMLRRGGIGGGLGAVIRLSHSFRVDTLPDGKEIEVVRYLKRPLGRPEGERAADLGKSTFSVCQGRDASAATQEP